MVQGYPKTCVPAPLLPKIPPNLQSRHRMSTPIMPPLIIAQTRDPVGARVRPLASGDALERASVGGDGVCGCAGVLDPGVHVEVVDGVAGEVVAFVVGFSGFASPPKKRGG